MRRTLSSLVVAFTVLPLIAAAPSTQPAAANEVSPGTALARKLPQIRITEVALEDAIDFLRDVSGANIHVNWRALEFLNVTRQMPVTLQLDNVTVRRALRSLLDETGVGGAITFYVDDGVVEITTTELADQKLITRVYYVEDLLMVVPDFIGPTFNLQNQSNTASGAGGGGSSGGTLFQDSGDRNEQLPTKQARGEALVELIQQTIRPEVWRDNGGTASIRYFNGRLIVTAPRSVHESMGRR